MHELFSLSRNGFTLTFHLVSDTCTTAAPGQKECDSALREMQSAATLLDTPNEPVNDNSYFQCLDTVVDKSGVLGQAMTGESSALVHSIHVTP